MKKPNYTPEIRERAVQLLIESEKAGFKPCDGLVKFIFRVIEDM